MKFIDCVQGSPEWYKARTAIPTASMFASVMAEGDGKMRRTYMLKLAGECVSGQPMESFSNSNMERGRALEDEARSHYAFMTNSEPKRVGFITNGKCGCSPDSFLGDDGILEIKTAFPHILIDYMLKDNFPPQHKAQCQGSLLVTGRKWIDIAVYYPNMPMFIKRAFRDNNYIAELSREIDRFNKELAAIVKQIKGHK